MPVKMSLRAFKRAESDLQNDEEFVLRAMKKHSVPFSWISYTLKKDKAFVLKAIAALPQNAAGILRDARDALSEDRDVVLAAVLADGKALRHAGYAPRADKQVVLSAVRQCGKALQSAAPSLQKDYDVARAAVESMGTALEFVSDELKADSSLVLAAVRNNGWALPFASSHLRHDDSLAVQAFKTEQLRLRNGHYLEPCGNPLAAALKHVFQKWHFKLLGVCHPNDATAVVQAFVGAFQRDDEMEVKNDARILPCSEVEAFVDALAFMSGLWKDWQALHECAEDAMRVIARPSGPLGKRDRNAYEAELL